MLAANYTRSLKEDDFDFISQCLRKRVGIHLGPTKRDLAQTRLNRRLEALQLSSFEEYRSYLESLPPNDPEWQRLINELTTNKTDFFRENAHFEFLEKQLIPKWRTENPKAVFHAWSAACSTGQEPYTLAMVLERAFSRAIRSFEILATDVDTNALAHGINGVYSRNCLDEIPREFQDHSLALGTGEISDWFKIKKHLRSTIRFEQFNLAGNDYSIAEKPNLIMCRNVFIYFKSETIQKAVQGFYEVAAPGAILMIGHSETLQGINNPWTYVSPSIFRKGG